jgi:GLPGLI family protein
MKTLKHLCIVLINIIEVNSQNKTSGVVTYSASTKMVNTNKKPNNSNINKLFESMTNFGENLELSLYFKNNLAYFTCETSLLLNKGDERIYNLAKVKFKTMTNYYYDLKQNEYIEEKDFGGDIFLIKKNINITDWKLVNETKKIGNYICYKATRNFLFTNWKKNKVLESKQFGIH